MQHRGSLETLEQTVTETVSLLKAQSETLKNSTATLERTVADRTIALLETTQSLEKEIQERQFASEQLEKMSRQNQLILNSAGEAAGGTVVGEAYPALRETRDYGPYLAQVKAAAPQAMFVFFAGGPAIQFVKQYADFGLKDTIKLAGAGWLTSPLYIDAQGPAAADVLGILNYVPSIETPENVEFQLAFQNTFGRVASEFAVQGYDTARLIIEALALTEGDVDNRAALVAAMHKVTFTGPRGVLRIDPATNNIIQDIHIFETRAVGDKVRAVVIDTLPAMRDPPNGCRL